MKKVPFLYMKKRGLIEYFAVDKEFRVTHENKQATRKLVRYLTKKREFWIPQSSQLDDYKIVKAYPFDDETYFSLSLMTAYTKTGCWILWDEKEI